jgi:hypothetical protein
LAADPKFIFFSALAHQVAAMQPKPAHLGLPSSSCRSGKQPPPPKSATSCRPHYIRNSNRRCTHIHIRDEYLNERLISSKTRRTHFCDKKRDTRSHYASPIIQVKETLTARGVSPCIMKVDASPITRVKGDAHYWGRVSF